MVLIVQTGDWHIGLIIDDIDPENHHKITTYNVDIAENDLQILINKVKDYFNKSDEDEIKIVIVGDIVEGMDNYKHQLLSSISINEQLSHGRRLLRNFRDQLSDISGNKIEMYCVAGNHGRVSPERPAYRDNLEYPIFEALKEDGDCPIFITPQDYGIFKIGNKFYEYLHGDQMSKGHQNIAFYGVLKSIYTYRRRYEADVMMVGHHHAQISDIIKISPKKYVSVYMSGCLPTEGPFGVRFFHSTIRGLICLNVDDNGNIVGEYKPYLID